MMPSAAVAYLPASRSYPNDRPRYLLTNSHRCRYDQRIGWKGRFRRVSPVARRPREGPLTEPIAGAQPRPQERVLMPEAV